MLHPAGNPSSGKGGPGEISSAADSRVVVSTSCCCDIGGPETNFSSYTNGLRCLRRIRRIAAKITMPNIDAIIVGPLIPFENMDSSESGFVNSNVRESLYSISPSIVVAMMDTSPMYVSPRF